MEIEDPGLWQVNGPASLFDILGTRSGRGSMWLEVDLRFKLNLGPVKISGATIRATREDDGSFCASLRGLDASVSVAGAIEGHGSSSCSTGAASLPSSMRTSCRSTSPRAPSFSTCRRRELLLYLKIGVDLPGPIPVANTGLGIYGVAGAFGVNARPRCRRPADPDPIGFQLALGLLRPETAFAYSQDNLTIGAEAVIGTVPDLGFSFSAKAGLFLTIPDLAIRGACGATCSRRGSRSSTIRADRTSASSFKGIVVVDPARRRHHRPEGRAAYPGPRRCRHPARRALPVLAAGRRLRDWFIYLGADGYSSAVAPPRDDPRGRARRILPDMPTSADAYLMQRGRGIEKWPRGGPITVTDGLVLAFGFGFEYAIGVIRLVWAEVHASADVLLANDPLTLAGFGTAGGSLNLGPLSVGVDAQLSLLWPRITIRTSTRNCAATSICSSPRSRAAWRSRSTASRMSRPPAAGRTSAGRRAEQRDCRDLGFLVDDSSGASAARPSDVQPAHAVWPDALLHLSFAVSPQLAPGYVAKNGAVERQGDRRLSDRCSRRRRSGATCCATSGR